MAGKSKYTDAEKAAALRDYEIFGPSWVEKNHNIPKQTVQTWAKAADLRTVRNPLTYAATEARKLDLKHARQIILEGLYIDTIKIQADMHKPSFVFGIGGKDNSFEGQTLDIPLEVDRKLRMGMVTSAVNAAVKLEAVDNSSGVEEARSFVSDMAAYFGIGVKKEADQ